MTDRQWVLQLQNMSCSMRSGERIGMRETTKIDAGLVKIALDNQRPCAHWQASFRMVGKPHLTLQHLTPTTSCGPGNA
jgi:hypothetical protein